MDSPINRDELAVALKDALNPLLTELREMRTDISSLKLNSAPRTDVYDKAVMDEKLERIRAEISAAHKAIAASKEFSWKVIGGVGTVLLIIATFAPHIHFS